MSCPSIHCQNLCLPHIILSQRSSSGFSSASLFIFQRKEEEAERSTVVWQNVSKWFRGKASGRQGEGASPHRRLASDFQMSACPLIKCWLTRDGLPHTRTGLLLPRASAPLKARTFCIAFLSHTRRKFSFASGGSGVGEQILSGTIVWLLKDKLWALGEFLAWNPSELWSLSDGSKGFPFLSVTLILTA